MACWLTVALFATAISAWPQNAVVAGSAGPAPKAFTPAGAFSVRVQPLQRTPDLLVVLAADCLDPADYDDAKKLIVSSQKQTSGSGALRIVLFQAGAAQEPIGPFRSTIELQAALRKIKPAPDAVACPDPADFYTRLAEFLAPIPSDWGFTLVIGHVPQFSDPAVAQFAEAWLIRECIAHQRTLLFSEPSALSTVISRATGAAGDDDPLATLTWDPFPLTRGFDLQDVSLSDVPTLPKIPIIAAAPDFPIPSIAAYTNLRAAIAHGDFEQALKINPSDREALVLAMKAAPNNISLLETAVELSPADAALWSRLGNLRYAEKSFPAAEIALLHAKDLGASSAQASEQLGRIAYERKDLARALDFIAESLRLDGTPQPLWFFAADIANELGRTDRQIDALEHGLAIRGHQTTRRAELIRIYLEKKDLANAARQADLELPNLPADADSQSTWARFYEQLSRPDDALNCWKRAAAADPKLEPAHYAIATILLNRKLYPDALEAAGRGLEADPKSARLELTKVTALENTGNIYEARRSLGEFAKTATDIDVLRREAELTDVYGGPAPEAAKRYAEAFAPTAAGDPDKKAELVRILERGAKVSARDSYESARIWFEDQLSLLKNPGSLAPSVAAQQIAPASQKQPAAVWIPGGIDALSFIVGAPPGIAPEHFLVNYSRRIVARAASANPQDTAIFQKGVLGYFAGVQQLLSLSARDGNRYSLDLSVENKAAQQRTEHVLELFGWKLSHLKDKLLVQSSEKAGQSKNLDLASALAIDQGGMQTAFQKGKLFRIEIPYEQVPVLFDEATWRPPLKTDKMAGGLAEALVANPDFARVYLGLGNVDRPTASLLLSTFGLGPHYAELLANYSSALAIVNGRAAVPGGTAAEPVWTKLAGASPAEAARFFRALFDKDQGRLLIWFFQLSEFDAPHQRFFTSSQRRMDDFYEAFSQSQDVRGRAGRMTRSNGFSEFLRSIPLDGQTVDFPGSAEVWMIANGRSVTAEQSGKLMRKVKKAVPPEVEDEILLRLARIRDKDENGGLAETAAFLATVRIDEHRLNPLDEHSALLLGQNYNEYQSFYPYFSELTSLNLPDFQAFFALLARLKSIDEAQAELALGQFEALLELLRLSLNRGTLSEDRATAVFRALCAGFATAQDRAGFSTASLDTVRQMLSGAKDPDNAMAELLLGNSAPIEIDWKGVSVSIDAAHKRSVAYGRVLDLQKIPQLSLLLRLDETVRRIAGGKEPLGPLTEALAKDADALPVADIPKAVKFEGRAKQIIATTSPAKLHQAALELSQTAAKKKVNPKDIQKFAHDFLDELSPQVRIGLAGLVFAVHLDPADILVANDPLLVRKHQSFDLTPSSSRLSRYPRSVLHEASAGEGSYFIGGFAHFSLTSASARGGARSDANSALLMNQMAAIRMTSWSHYSDPGQRLLGIRLRMAREWCVYAASDPAVFEALSEDTLGVLSLTRRRQLLNAISAKQWSGVDENLTLTDLLVLAERYLARYPKSPWNSPVDAELRRAAEHDSGLAFLGPVPASLYGCTHPHLVSLAPYEEYEHHLFPGEMAERTAEMNLYLAAALDRGAFASAALPAIAEEVAKKVFSGMRMADERDWISALRAFSAIDEKTIASAIEAVQ